MRVYRSPDGEFDIFLEKNSIASHKLTKSNKLTIVSGDLNVHFQNKNDRKAHMCLTTLVNTRHNNCLDNI